MDLIQRLVDAVSSRDEIVVLPEGHDKRILEAARRLTDGRMARIVILGDAGVVDRAASESSVSLQGISVIDPRRSDRLEYYAEHYAVRRKTVTLGVAHRLMRKPLFYAAMMVRLGDASAMVGGADNPTKRVIEAGRMAIGLAEGIETPSSFFLILVPSFRGESDRAFVFADCAINIDPTPEQLADIALVSATSAAKLLSEEPRVAMLSFSTLGSARHFRTEKVRQAAEIVKRRAPALKVEGELQVDAALIAEVAAKKINATSEVAGAANVLIFPDLDAGNIGYKLTQYMAGATAIGPILQGFSKPISDLSRGASVSEIVATTAITLALA